MIDKPIFQLRDRAIRAERILVSTILTYGRAELLPRDFVPRHPKLRVIAGAIRNLPRGAACNIQAIYRELARTNAKGEVGIAFLAECTDPAPISWAAPEMLADLIEEIAQLWRRYDQAVEALNGVEEALR